MNQKQIRNFCIISHIDHGKSTLADRFLEMAGMAKKQKFDSQYLDMMDLEQEKGITIKLQPVRLEFQFPISNFQFPNKFQINNTNSKYILNLIDTPGHSDFSYEVSRSLAAVEGVILLVDVLKGIQAQTLANLEMARMQNLKIIPVINKIDLADKEQIKQTEDSVSDLLKIAPEEIIKISAKYGVNIDQVLEAIIKKIPCPCSYSKQEQGQGQEQEQKQEQEQEQEIEKPLRALIFDSKYDSYKGVIAYVRIFDGKVDSNQKIYLMKVQIESQIKELGYFNPEFFPQKELLAGEIGYIATGIKDPEKIKIGDTIIDKSLILNSQSSIKPIAGYKEPKPNVFVSIYPEDANDYDLLKQSLAKLKLNDPSFVFTFCKIALGRGFLCGFLGVLHSEIIIERLKREFGLNLIVTAPSVAFKVFDKNNKVILISSSHEMPDYSKIKEIQEPWVRLEIILPNRYLGSTLKIIENLDAVHIETKYLESTEKIILIYEVPLREIISNFYDNLKSASQGYASMNYEILDYRQGDLVKLNILIAGQRQDFFSKIVPRRKAYQEGSNIIKKLKEILPAQLFTVPLQAEVQGRVIARETLSAKRKDVTASLYGGDVTRKRKLLEKQKKGKKKLEQEAKLRIPSRVFLEMMRS